MSEGGEAAPVLPFAPPDPDRQERMVEAILFAAREPLSTAEIEARMPRGSDAAEAVRRVETRWAERGVHVVRVAGGWAVRTAPDMAFLLRREAEESRKLSRAATETLAIVAYHQPVTRAEIEEVRGVAVSKGTLDMLIELGWVRPGRRREAPGRPVTYVTTDAFLDHFGLESVKDLPGLDELKAAGMLDARPTGTGPSLPSDDPDEGDPDDGPDRADLLG